ncbi:MAG: hypothetical protein OXT09_36645 [Myxococcales bacterium]|nr:hypothetical protein [Myxococcales bacterium]
MSTGSERRPTREQDATACDRQLEPTRASAGATVETEQLMLGALAGDSGAWQALMRAWAPRLHAMARGHRGLRTRGLVNDDDVAEVVVLTFERLRRKDFASLRRFIERRREQPAATLDAWLFGALDYSVRTHLRARFGRAPKIDGEAGPPRLSRRDVGSFAARLPEQGLDPAAQPSRWGVTDRLTLAEVKRAIESEFSPREARAFALHYEEGQDHAAIAAAIGLADARAAERMIRALNARLRYRFAR